MKILKNISLLGCALMIGGVSQASAQSCQFNFTPRTCFDVEELGFDARDINDRGTVVGAQFGPQDAIGIIAERGQQYEEIVIGSGGTVINRINEDGTVIGYSYEQGSAATTPGFIRTEAGDVAHIDSPDHVMLYDISNNGTVVGGVANYQNPAGTCGTPLYITPQADQPTPYSNTYVDLYDHPNCSPNSGHQFTNSAINSSGVFVGGSLNYLGIFDPKFLPTSVKQLEVFTTGSGEPINAYASAINESRQVAGSFENQAVVWNADGFPNHLAYGLSNHANPSELNGWAADINECGQSVGTFQTAQGNYPFAFISKNDQTFDLNARICPGNISSEIRTAIAINNKGEIIAQAITTPGQEAVGVILRPRRGKSTYQASFEVKVDR